MRKYANNFDKKKTQQFHLINLAGFFLYIKRMQKQDFKLL